MRGERSEPVRERDEAGDDCSKLRLNCGVRGGDIYPSCRGELVLLFKRGEPTGDHDESDDKACDNCSKWRLSCGVRGGARYIPNRRLAIIDFSIITKQSIKQSINQSSFVYNTLNIYFSTSKVWVHKLFFIFNTTHFKVKTINTINQSNFVLSPYSVLLASADYVPYAYFSPFLENTLVKK